MNRGVTVEISVQVSYVKSMFESRMSKDSYKKYMS